MILFYSIFLQRLPYKHFAARRPSAILGNEIENTPPLYLMKKYRFHLTLLSLIAIAQSAQANESIGGETLFAQNCAECHQTNGKGITDIYPSLAGSEVVKGSGIDVALVLLIGRGEMPSFAGAISDEDMAKIINYVRNSWGNEGELITAKMIGTLK